MLSLKKFLVEALFEAVLIYLVFTLISRFILPFVRGEKWSDRLSFYTPVLRNLSFIVFLVYVLLVLAIAYPYATLIGVASLLLLLWGIIREVFQGTLFRLYKGNLAGQRIQFKDYAGKILDMKNIKMEIETDKGELLQIPYSQIISGVEVKPSTTRNLKTCNVELKLNSTDYIGKEEEWLRKLATIPYVVLSKVPKIEVLDQSGDQLHVKVVVYTNSDEFIPSVRQYITSL